MNARAELDIGPLSWVKGEIDLALERAGGELRAHAQTPGDGAHLRSAQTLLHQAHGALAVVGLAGITEFSQAIERLLAAIEQGQVADSNAAGESVQQGMGALRNYLDDLVNGSPNRPLSLFPIYRALLTARGVTETPASDLFFPDLTQRPPRREVEPEALAPDAVMARWKMARLGFQRGLLKWIRNDDSGLREMRNSTAIIEQTQLQPAARAPWWVALAVFDALVLDGVAVDASVRRLGSRLDAQIRKLFEGSVPVSERLLRDLLYIVATSTHSNEHIASVRYAYRLAELIPQRAASADLEPVRIHLRTLREQIALAKDHWDQFSAGLASALPPFHEGTARLVSHGEAIKQVDLMRLVAAIANVANMLRKDPLAHTDSIALEVATALLLVEEAVDQLERQDGQPGVEFTHLVDLTAGRLSALLRGETLAAADSPQLTVISQRARQRLVMRQAVKEIQANLAVIEQSLDTFFRNPAKNAELTQLSKPIAQIETALSAIGEQRAIAVLAECAASIEAFARSGYIAQLAVFEDVARKLSALGLFVNQRQTGAADIDVILSPTRISQGAQPTEQAAPYSTVESEMAGRAEMTRTLVGALRNAPQDTALRSELKQNLQGLREDAQFVADTALEQRADAAIAALEAAQSAEQLEQAVAPLTAHPTTVEHSAAAMRLAAAGSEQIDAELLEIFLEEACEVLAAVAEEVPKLSVAQHAHEPQSTLQRAFHTLKGSGHMVGLGAFASTAMVVEDVMSRWLQLEQPANPPLLAMLRQAHALFAAWVEQLKTGNTRTPDIAALIALCAQLQKGETPAVMRLPEPAAPPMIRVGALHLAQPLFNIFLEDARSRLDVLRQEFPLCRQQPPRQDMMRSAHTLAGASATIGLGPLQEIAHALEHALERFAAANAATSTEQQTVISRAIEALAHMVDMFAGERMPERADALAAELHALAPALPEPAPAQLRNPATTAPEKERRLSRLENDIDPQLLPLFLEESADLTAAIAAELRNWRGAPDNASHAEQLRRLLHTLKGSARMAGALAVGELAHHMETRIAQTVHAGPLRSSFLEALEASFDRAVMMIETLRVPLVALPAESLSMREAAPPAEPAEPSTRGLLRVRAEDLDQLINEGSEIAVARSRIEGEMRVLRNSLRDMTDNVIRLRGQLREIEIQAETQIQSRQATHAEHQEEFDPLEKDRYTRLQELTRMMAESVNDVATVQHTLLRNIDHAETALAGQSRLNRDLSQRLMNLRMVPLASIAERLYRVVRQTAKELGKRANLDIRGGQIELDRSVLEKMTSPIENLLRNAVAHGLESGAARQAAGKPEQGEIVFSVMQEANEVVMELDDDGAGLDYPMLRAKAEQLGLLAPGQTADDAHLTQLIFLPGFTTAGHLTAISGRGIGMDVVRTEAMALGGRIEVNSRRGQGTTFRICLPVTLSIAPVLLVKSGARIYAIPSAMVQQAQELRPEAIASTRAAGAVQWQGASYRWHYLPRLLGDADAVPETQHRYWLILIKGGAQHIAVEIDALIGNQEVVVKSIGPQLARVAGIAGATVLDDGDITLILNPVALASRETQYDTGSTGVALGRTVGASSGRTNPAPQTPLATNTPGRTQSPPTVLVVDDSITVRKVASRQLERAGYRVLAAKDGIDALQQLQETVPDVMLADIEMPRMDGFELARNVRADARLKHLPIIMITSRIADKHRNYATEIGVNHYLGKPYDEQELLRLVAGYIVRPG